MHQITYTAMEHLHPSGGPQYDEAKLKHHGIEPHETKTLDALGIKPDHDPLETTVCGVTFKHGEPVDVPDDHPVLAVLASNPWFEIKAKKSKKKEDDHA